MRFAILLLSVVLLSACGDRQQAAYLIAGGSHSLSLTREQAYLGSEWDTGLVVARMPFCQRLYPLKGVTADKIKVDLYRTEPGVFILNAGKRWYVTETESCRFEQYKEPPPQPGDLIGSFQVKDGALIYKELEQKPPAAAVAPAPTPAAK